VLAVVLRYFLRFFVNNVHDAAARALSVAIAPFETLAANWGAVIRRLVSDYWDRGTVATEHKIRSG
jgi:hypothetical protein